MHQALRRNPPSSYDTNMPGPASMERPTKHLGCSRSATSKPSPATCSVADATYVQIDLLHNRCRHLPVLVRDVALTHEPLPHLVQVPADQSSFMAPVKQQNATSNRPTKSVHATLLYNSCIYSFWQRSASCTMHSEG